MSCHHLKQRKRPWQNVYSATREREKEKCEGCPFAQPSPASRNYKGVPYFSIKEMADSLALEDIAMVIERGLCQVWTWDRNNVNDRTAARLVELMLDRYHFDEAEPPITDPGLAAGYQDLARTIEQKLSHVPVERLVKVLAAVYRSILRRSTGGQDYLQFVSSQYIWF